VAIYYFLIREAGLGHDSHRSANALVTAHRSGTISRSNDLPADTETGDFPEPAPRPRPPGDAAPPSRPAPPKEL
jgi:hypothetical protein